MSNLGFVKAMESAGIKVEKTAVGDRYVLENMLANNHQLGGEQSGHIILRSHANTGDGVLTALHLMQVMVETGKSLEELASVMKRFPQVLINVKDVDKSRLDSSKAISELIASCESDLGDNGRILVRASGTESLVRVMVEAASIEQAQEIAEKLAEIVRLELK